MNANSTIPTHFLEITDVDMQIFQLRLAGKSAKAVTRVLKISEDRVKQTIDAALPPLTAKTKADMLLLELARLDVYQTSQYAAAAKGDRAAIACSLEITKMRADLAGLWAASNVRLDPILLVEAGQPQLSTSDKIQAALDALRNNHKPPALTDGSPPVDELAQPANGNGHIQSDDDDEAETAA